MDERRRRWIAEVQNASRVLLNDTQLALEGLHSAPPYRSLPLPEASESMIWGRTVIRNLVGWADSAASIMLSCVREARQFDAITLSAKEQKKLHYRARHGPIDRVKLGYKLFPRLFEVDFQLDTGGQNWELFRDAVTARNAATHPSGLEAFRPVSVRYTVEQLVAWLLCEDWRLLKMCAGRIGLELEELAARDVERSGTTPADLHPPDYEQIQRDASLSLDLLASMQLIVYEELDYFLGWLSERRTNDPDPEATGFGWRTVVRAICSLAEALESATERFLVSAEQRCEISISRAARRRIEKATRSRPERLATWLEAYAEQFGTYYRTDRNSSEWRCFRAIWDIRDRVTHPKNAEELQIRDGEYDIVLGAVGWVAHELGTALRLDEDRWAESTVRNDSKSCGDA